MTRKSRTAPVLPVTLVAPAIVESVEPKVTRSVVPAAWRAAAKAHGGSCGDATAARLTEYATVKSDDGVAHISRAKLRAFGQANGLWQDKYESLNVGMVRMNVGNRLRAAQRREGFVTQWPK